MTMKAAERMIASLAAVFIYDRRENQQSAASLKEHRRCEMMEESLSIDWDDALESAAREVGERAQAYKIINARLAHSSSRVYDWLMIGSIITGPMSGTISAIGSAMSPDPTAVLPIVSTLVAFLAGILVAVVRFGKYDEKTTAHKQAAAKLASIEHNVRRQMALPRDRREKAQQYLEWITKSSDDVCTSMPLIPRSAQEQYAAEAEKKGLAVPDPVGDTIEINRGFAAQLSSSERVQVAIDVEEEKEKDPRREVKRTNSIGVTPELELYSDSQMRYQLSRLFNV
jgi:hypothetical protein